MRKHITIFSGYNQRAVIAFLRVLKRCEIRSFSVIASSENDMILKTDYRNHVFYIRKHKELDIGEFTELFIRLKKEKNVDEIIVLPSTEALNRFVLDNREYFKRINVSIPLVDKKVYELVSDKEKFWTYCKGKNITVPTVFDFPKEYSVRFVAKPKEYIGHDGKAHTPCLILSQNDYTQFVRENEINDFTYQEYIEGRSYYLLYYFMRDGGVIKFSQINYLQQPGGKSIVMAAPAEIHHEAISEKYEAEIKKLNFTGLLMIEIRERNNEYYMIEANPRLWGPSQLFVDAGIPFFETFLNEYGFLKESSGFYENADIRYYWSGGGRMKNCFWHEGGEQDFLKNSILYEQFDIYKRSDTIAIYKMEGEI